jgi:hypothetical protein
MALDAAAVAVPAHTLGRGAFSVACLSPLVVVANQHLMVVLPDSLLMLFVQRWFRVQLSYTTNCGSKEFSFSHVRTRCTMKLSIFL